MLTLDEFKVKYRDIEKRMQRIHNLASHFRSYTESLGVAFILDFNAYQSTVRKLDETFTTAPSFKSKDFTRYAERWDKELDGWEERYRSTYDRVILSPKRKN